MKKIEFHNRERELNEIHHIYINIRTKFLSSYEDFVESLFEIEIEETDYIFKDKKPTNAFSYILKLFEQIKYAGKQPVLIFDLLNKYSWIQKKIMHGSIAVENPSVLLNL